MKIEDIVQGIVVGIIFTCAGFTMTFKKKKFIDALLSSNKIFWEKMNLSVNEDKNKAITNIMIPLMGLVFLAVGIFSIFKVLTSLFA